LEVRCLGCETHQTVDLTIVRRPKITPIHEFERWMCCRDCSKLRGYPMARDIGHGSLRCWHDDPNGQAVEDLVALRDTDLASFLTRLRRVSEAKADRVGRAPSS
jgi:hypothetical protein